LNTISTTPLFQKIVLISKLRYEYASLPNGVFSNWFEIRPKYRLFGDFVQTLVRMREG